MCRRIDFTFVGESTLSVKVNRLQYRRIDLKAKRPTLVSSPLKELLLFGFMVFLRCCLRGSKEWTFIANE